MKMILFGSCFGQMQGLWFSTKYTAAYANARMPGKLTLRFKPMFLKKSLPNILCVTAITLLTVVVCISPNIAYSAESVARDAQLGGDAQRTRFVTVLSKKVKFGIRTLADPYRVIVDLSDVKLELPKDRGKEGKGLVTGYRYGRVEPYGVRIILDVNAPVLVDRAEIVEASNGQPPKFVVELTRTNRKAFLANQRQQLAAVRRNARSEAPKVAPKPKRSKSAKKIIAIDAGHGGIDPGAVSKSGLKEKDIVFSFSKTLRNTLNNTGKYEAVLTRSVDSYVPLRKRVEIARELGADLFLSIHADALPGRYAKTVAGATVYTLSEKASDDEAKVLAAAENKSDIIAGVELPPESDDVANILIDLAQRETKNLSISFAGILVESLRSKTQLSKKSRKFAGFRVLKAPDIPSVLLELGYMTNPADVRRLQSSKWRLKVSNVIARAIDTYFTKRTAQNPY